MRLDQLSYANQNQPLFKRWIIRSIEGLSGRDRYFSSTRPGVARSFRKGGMSSRACSS